MTVAAKNLEKPFYYSRITNKNRQNQTRLYPLRQIDDEHDIHARHFFDDQMYSKKKAGPIAGSGFRGEDLLKPSVGSILPLLVLQQLVLVGVDESLIGGIDDVVTDTDRPPASLLVA